MMTTQHKLFTTKDDKIKEGIRLISERVPLEILNQLLPIIFNDSLSTSSSPSTIKEISKKNLPL
ncbi:CLUMA_CG020939, isoform A, partial [Clunio marinus]